MFLLEFLIRRLGNVTTRDHTALAHALFELGLSIAVAKINTEGTRVVDVFYVKDVFGLKVENDRKLGQLRTALLAALDTPDEPQPAPEPTRPRRRRATAAA